MSFDYRARPVQTSRGGIVLLVVVGVVLVIACGSWLFAPIIANASRATTTGTIASYGVEVAPAPGTTAQFRPTIEYSVDGEHYTLVATQTVTAPDRRRMPVGSSTTVRYDPGDPSSASWAPGGTAVAVNTWGIVGVVTGFALIAAAIMLRALNRPSKQVRTKSGEN